MVFNRSCRNRTLGKAKPCLFCLRRSQLASAKGAGIEARRRVPHKQGHCVPLYRHLSADGATGAASGRVRAEETCPPAQPLVQSVRAVAAHWPRILRQPLEKDQSFVLKGSQKLSMFPMSMKTEGVFQFGEFQIDARARTLRREKATVTLNFRAFDMLLYFVQNPGRVLTRDELLKNVWPDAFVDEHSLAQSISVLRRALDEKPGDNSYIVTLPGRGYQFVAPVQVVATSVGHALPGVATAEGHGSLGMLFQEHTVRTSVITEEKQQLSLPPPRNWALVRFVAILAVAATSVTGYYAWTRFRRIQPQTNPAATSSSGRPLAPRRSVAVLGFRNLSGRPDEGWLSTALAEMLSTELEAGEKLRLVSGEDIARTKRDLPLADADSLSRETLARLHKDLDSDLIVLGSYTALGEKPGTRIRLDLRLQDTAAGETIADVAVVGSEADLFDMVSQAGSRLREKLGVQAVSPVEAVSVRASSPSNREAARLYSEGLARLRVLDALEARDLLQQAIAADPKFSLAHSALAEAWSRLGYDKSPTGGPSGIQPLHQPFTRRTVGGGRPLS